MELRELEAFVKVVAHGSFSRAAETLGTNQPALSRLVRRLEVELHQTLLVRNGRGAVPTAAGEVLLAHCREILHHVELARDAMQSLQGSARQKFTLGMVPHVARLAVPSLVRDLRARFPRAAIKVVEGVSNALLESLLTDRIDAAILYETPRAEQIDKRTLLREEIYLVGPAVPDGQAQDSVAFANLGRYPLILSSRMHAIREVVEAQAARHQVVLHIALEVDVVGSALDLVQEGFGHALLPLNALERDGRQRQLSVTRITGPVLHCRLVIATGRKHAASGFVRNALELLEERIAPLYVQQEDALTRRLGPRGTTKG